MKRLLFLLLVLAGCSTLSEMNSNLEQSTAMLEKNTATVAHSSSVIQSNTEEISRSTAKMSQFGMLFPFFAAFILILLFYPSFHLLKQHRKIQADMKHLLKKFKK